MRFRDSLLPALFFLASLAIGQLTPTQKQANLDAFDYVWKTVQAKHWDPSMGGVDWAKVRDELRPRLENAESDEEARRVIAEMLDRLHLSHFAVIPGAVYNDVANATAPGDSGASSFEEGTTGIDVRAIDDEVLVVGVDAVSPANKAGVRPGWVVQSVDGEDMTPVMRRVASSYQKSTLREMMLTRAALSRLEGPIGNPIEIVFRDSRNRSIDLTLDRIAPRGVPVRFGYLPQSYFWIESRRIDQQVEYVAFNYFLDPDEITAKFQQALRSCSGCGGIVIDLRGNPGGIGILASGIAGYFIDRPNLKLGTMYMRDLPLKFVVNPRPPVFHGSLAILVDGLSASTSEIFAGGMQDLKRARIFGTRTAGAALPSMIERLPNGDAFQYAAATYRSESGKTLEGNGVIPDEIVHLSRPALLSGRDPVIDAAVKWIHSQSTQGTIAQ